MTVRWNRSTAVLAFVHLAGNALLLWLGYYWLGLSESDALHLAWSLFLVLLLTAGAAWLHGTALVYFDPEVERSFGESAKTAALHLGSLFVIALIAFVLYGAIAYWRGAFDHSAFVVGSYATMQLRKPVAPSTVMRVFYGFIWLLRWVIVPVLLFPLAAAVARRGWSGFRLKSIGRSKRVLYWAEVCLLLLAALWMPLKLEGWVPKLEQFAMQMLSFSIRAVIGYLLFVGAMLALEFATSVGKSDSSHLKSTAAP